MNRFLVFLIVLAVDYGRLIADTGIPTSAWEEHPKGIATVLTYSAPNASRKTGTVFVNIKNSSSSSVYYVGWEGFNRGVEIYYLDTSGKEIAAGDYNWRGGSATPSPEVKPGDTIIRSEDFDSAKIALLSGRPISCHLFFYTHDWKIILKINSTPKVIIGK